MGIRREYHFFSSSQHSNNRVYAYLRNPGINGLRSAESSHEPIQEEDTTMAHFEQALKKLVEDANYRKAVIQDPKLLAADHKHLTANEMLLLMQIWLAAQPGAATESILTLCHCCTGHS
jgi:hypothetical protein